MADTFDVNPLKPHVLHTPRGFIVFNMGKTTKAVPGEYRERLVREGVIGDADRPQLDHDRNGEPGGAAAPAGEAATSDEIVAAIAELDNGNDEHWTQAGLPQVNAVAELTGKTVTRAAIDAAAPDAKRVVAPAGEAAADEGSAPA